MYTGPKRCDVWAPGVHLFPLIPPPHRPLLSSLAPSPPPREQWLTAVVEVANYCDMAGILRYQHKEKPTYLDTK